MTDEMKILHKEESWRAGTTTCLFCNTEVAVSCPRRKKNNPIPTQDVTLVCVSCRSIFLEDSRLRVKRTRTPTIVAGMYTLATVEVAVDKEIFAKRTGNFNKRCDLCMRKDWKIYNPYKNARDNKKDGPRINICCLCYEKKDTFRRYMEKDGLILTDIEMKEPEMAEFKAFYAKCKLNKLSAIVGRFKALYPDFDEEAGNRYIKEAKKAELKKQKPEKKPKNATKKKTTTRTVEVDEEISLKRKSIAVISTSKEPSAKRTKVVDPLEEEDEPQLRRKRPTVTQESEKVQQVIADEPVELPRKQLATKAAQISRGDDDSLKRKSSSLVESTSKASVKISASKRVKMDKDGFFLQDEISQEGEFEPEEEEAAKEPEQPRRKHKNGGRVIFVDTPANPNVVCDYLSSEDFEELFEAILKKLEFKPHRTTKDSITEAFGAISGSPHLMEKFCADNENLSKKLGMVGMAFLVDRVKKLAVSLFNPKYAINAYISKEPQLRWIASKISVLRCKTVNVGGAEFTVKQIQKKFGELREIVLALNKDAHQMLLDHIWTL